MKQIVQRGGILLLAFIVGVSFFASVLYAPVANAVAADDSSKNPDDWLPKTRAKRWAYLTGMYHCMEDGGYVTGFVGSTIEEGDVAKSNWFADPKNFYDRPNRPAGYIDIETKDNGNGKADCNIIAAALAGEYDLSPIELFCALGAKRDDGSPCVTSGTKSNFNPPSSKGRMDLTSVWGSKDLSSNAGAAAYYELNLAALTNSKGCNLKEDSSASGDYAYTLKTVDATGQIVEKKFTGQKHDHKINVYTSYPGINDQERSCSTIASDLGSQATDYAKWVRGHLESADGGTSDPEADTETTSCAIDNIGWIVCPVMNFMARIIDQAYKQVASWLSVTPVTTTGGGSAMYSAWVAMRDIANVAFVIAFMIIVYSQLTSVGVSNYGIKKLLPKIIMAAILVNMSYILCAVAVDLSNIAGNSLYSLFKSDAFAGGIDTSHFKGDLSSTGDGWAGIVAAILASAAIIYLALPALIVALPTALLAIVTVFLVLALRQVLIILLIVISPLAFIALLLPNTEDWFKRWRTLFFSLLMMYPIISVLFGASAMASTIVMNSATDVEGDGKIALQLMGALITILPLVLTPFIMKASSGVLNRFAGIVNNPNKGPFDALRKRAEATAGRIRNNRDYRAVNSNRPSFRRAGLVGAAKRDAIQQKRDAAVKGLAYQGSAAKYTSAAKNAELETKALENEFEKQHLEGNVDLHAKVITSELDRQLAEKTHRDETEEAHVMNNRNAYQRSYGAAENLEAMKTESHNEFGRTEQGEVTAARVKAATGEKKIVEGEHDLAFQTSAVGQDQSGRLKGVEGQLDIVRGEQENTFKSSAVGQAQAQQKKVVQGTGKIIEGQAEVAYKGSDVGVNQAVQLDAVEHQQAAVAAQAETVAMNENTDFHVQSQAAKDTLEAAKSEETAFIQELRTEAGAADHLIGQQSPEVQQTVAQLQIADTQKRVQTQRAANAQNVATTEYAAQVEASSGIAGGLADVAGGIDPYGATRAVSTATQVAVEQFNKNVSTEKATMTSMDQSEWMSIVQDPNQSDERRAAAAGKIMQGGSMKSIHDLYNYTMTTAGNPAQQTAIRNIQQQMGGDLGRSPFGMGDTDRAAMTRGGLTPDVVFKGFNPSERATIESKITAPSDASKPISHYDVMLGKRAKGKMSPEALVAMDPDDRTRYAELIEDSAGDGGLVVGTEARTNIVSSIRAAAKNEKTKGIPKTDAKNDYNRILMALGEAPMTDADWE